MKIGICASMTPTAPDGTGMESLPLVRRAEFEYVEAPAAQLLALPDGERDAMVKKIRESGVPCLCLNNLFQPGIRLTGPNVDAAAVDAYIDRAVDLGKRLGVETMVFGSSGARNVPMGFPREKAWEQLLDMLSRLAPKAAKIGVTVVIEHLNHLESNIVDFFGEGLRLVREAKQPNVCAFVDYYHLALGNESLALVEENFDVIRHAHFANVLGRTIPTRDLHEEGVVAFLALLKRKGYKYKVSVEGYGKDLPALFFAAAAFMREHLR